MLGLSGFQCKFDSKGGVVFEWLVYFIRVNL